MPSNAYTLLYLHKTQGMNVSLHHFYDCCTPGVGTCVFTPSLRTNFLVHASQMNGRSSLRKRKCRCKRPLRMNILWHNLQTNGRCAWCMSWCFFSSNWFLNDVEHKSQRFGWYVARTGWRSFRVLCQKKMMGEKQSWIGQILLRIGQILLQISALNFVKIHLVGVKLLHVDKGSFVSQLPTPLKLYINKW